MHPPMPPTLPQDILISILDALDDEYAQTGTDQLDGIWDHRRLSTLRNLSLASHTLCAFSRPRLFAHIEFDASGDAQSRAARLLEYFPPGQFSEPRAQQRLRSVLSFRFRDSRGAPTPGIVKARWGSDLATPLERLLSLISSAPRLRTFVFQGDSWTLAGAGQLVGYQDYILRISSKSSLRALAVVNARDVPIDVLYRVVTPQGERSFGLRTLHLFNVTFAQTNGVEEGEVLKLRGPHPVERLRLGRVNPANLLAGSPHGASISDIGGSFVFDRLKSLSITLSSSQLSIPWDVFSGLRDSLQDLQVRNYDIVSEKTLSSLLQSPDSQSFDDGQIFSNLERLTISTSILASAMHLADGSVSMRWGLPPLVDLLGKFLICPTPKLREFTLELFFMGIGPGEGQGQKGMQDNAVSFENTAGNPLQWRSLDRLIASNVLGRRPAVAISVILRPFFFIRRCPSASVSGACSSFDGKRGLAGLSGLDRCLPKTFAKARVDIRLEPVMRDRDMLTYLQSR